MLTAQILRRRIVFVVASVTLLLSLGRACAAQLQWALEHHSLDQEKLETLKDLHYFSASRRYFQVRTADIKRVSEMVEIFEEDAEPTRIQAPQGTTWDFSEVWCLPDVSLLVWRATNASGPVWQFTKGLPLEILAQVPVRADSGECSAQIDGNRLSFHGTMPKELLAFFPATTAVPPRQPAWFELMLAADRDDLIDADFRIHEMTATPGEDSESKKAANIARKWLELPRLAFTPDEILGKWKVRSLQGGPDFHVLYPFFNAEFRKEDGRIVFQKTTGSQRRMGFVFPDQSTRMIFLGGKTVNDDTPLSYSRLDPKMPASADPRDSDSFGYLVKTGEKRYLMFLDVRAGQEYEIYEIVNQPK